MRDMQTFIHHKGRSIVNSGYFEEQWFFVGENLFYPTLLFGLLLSVVVSLEINRRYDFRNDSIFCRYIKNWLTWGLSVSEEVFFW